jgi:hypothetical protein
MAYVSSGIATYSQRYLFQLFSDSLGKLDAGTAQIIAFYYMA